MVFLLILWCTYTVHLMNCKSKMKWKIVIIQTFKWTCWQRIRQQKINKGCYFSKCNTTHRKKCCELQFWRIWQGYTHPTLTASIAYILYRAFPKFWWGGGTFLNKRWTHDWKDIVLGYFCHLLCTSCTCYWQPTLLPPLYINQIGTCFDLDNFIVFSFYFNIHVCGWGG